MKARVNRWVLVGDVLACARGPGLSWCQDRAEVEPFCSLSLSLRQKQVEPNFVSVDIALVRAAGSR